jgi:general secretion pathway protein M
MNRLKLIAAGFRDLDPRLRLRLGIGCACLLAVALLLSLVNGQTKRLEKLRTARESELAEMMQLRQRHQEASASAQKVANRLAAVRPDDSPARLIEEIGIKGKSLQINPLKGEDQAGFLVDSAEVKIESITTNELVNLLHRLEQGDRPASVRRALIKARFDDPARLDASLTVALQKPVPKQ